MSQVVNFPRPNQRQSNVTTAAFDAVARHQPELATALAGENLRVRILRDGDSVNNAGNDIHIVVSGCLKKTRMDAMGDAHIDTYLFPGDIIQSEKGYSNFCTVTTAYDTVSIVSLSRRELSSPAVAALLDAIAKSCSTAMIQAETLSFYVTKKSAGVKLAWFLYSMWSRTTGYLGSTEQTDIMMPMPRADIANYLGLAAETVSRELSQLSRQGIINVDKRTVQITDPNALARVAHVGSYVSEQARSLH